MTKPQQSTTLHSINNIFNTQSTQQLLTRFSIMQRNATHPPHHYSLRSHQSSHVLNLCSPSLTTTHTRCTFIPFSFKDAPLVVKIGASAMNLLRQVDGTS